jgi:hypothetical protein
MFLACYGIYAFDSAVDVLQSMLLDFSEKSEKYKYSDSH